MKKRNPFGKAGNRLARKLLLLMKLTIILLLATVIQVSGKGFSQNRITLNLKAANFKNALQQIEKLGGVRFLYNDALFTDNSRVDVNASNANLTDVLDRLFEGTAIKYKLLDNNLVALSGALENEQNFADNIRVTGKVSDSLGNAVSGASVTVSGTKAGTSTDAAGAFVINVAPDATLVISSVNYVTKEVAVNGNTNLSIILDAASQSIEQVVVVGYGTQRKIDITGAVTQLKGEEIAKQASVNPISALQGKVAGVQITNSGAPGASPQIRIRGVGTVYGNANPLYVVDGVWYDDISFLNSNDIENISILKDASSESIYGIRAANGVVLITTKKGRTNGQPLVSYNGYVGYQTVTNQVQMSNASEYATIINELYNINGKPNLFTDPASFGTGTDWYHQVLRNAMVNSHQVSVSGGGEKSNYSFSLGYLDQDGIVSGNNYKRYTARLQNDIQLFKSLRVGYNLTGAFSTSEDIPGSIFHQLYAAGPVVPVRYADGSYGDPSDYSLGDGNNFNPQVTLDFFNQHSKNYRGTGSIYADLKFAKHFTLHSSVGGELGQGEVQGYTPVYVATLKQRNMVSSLNISRAETRNWIVENTLTYDNKFGDHSVRVLLGQSAQRYKSYAVSASAQGVPNTSDGDYYLRLGNTGTTNVSDQGDLSTIASYFARLNYAYKGKYLLTATMRADGSSKFTGDNRWGNFPSVGLGWVISNEGFMQSQHVFDNLKLRASWGKIGNASVPANISTLVVAQGGYLTAIFGNNPATGASINSVVPPTTFWERGVGTDIGLEGAILKNRLTFDADYYIKKTEDAIFAIPILTSIGTSSSQIIGNQANFENRGFELALTWKSNISKGLSYSVSGNIGINDNKVLSVTTGSNPIYGGGAGATGGALTTRTILGQPIGQFYGYLVDGIFQTAAEIAGSAQPDAKPGDFRYRDISGSTGKPDNTISGLDRVALGNPNPKYSYGINTTWAYSTWDLTLDFQGVAGVDIYNANLGLRFGNENFSKDYFDSRWHGQGTASMSPSANIGGGKNYLPNSYFVQSGSYFRVRNMQLGYTVASALSNGWKIKKIRAFIDAQNAFNFFSYKGFSPEVGGTPTNAGIDANVYPLSATYRFGVNVTF